MAILSGGILGPVRKKVGNVVGSTWKGINVVRQMPAHVHNPNSEAQQEVRGKFRYASKLASGVLDTIIKPFWDKQAVKMSGYNLLMKKQLERWRDLEEPDIDSVMFSEGCNVSFKTEAFDAQGPLVQILLGIDSDCATPGVAQFVYLIAVNAPNGAVLAVLSEDYSDNTLFKISCIPESRLDDVEFYAFIGNPSTGLMSETARLSKNA